MKIWIDCEWNGPGGSLLSMALVANDGRQFYAVFDDMIVDRLHQWVAENVWPVRLAGCEAELPGVINRGVLPTQIEAFLAPYDAVHIIADWPEDVARFCMVMITGPGQRINTPPLTFEVCRDDAVSKVPHNALEDARALRLLHLSRERAVLPTGDRP